MSQELRNRILSKLSEIEAMVNERVCLIIGHFVYKLTDLRADRRGLLVLLGQLDPYIFAYGSEDTNKVYREFKEKLIADINQIEDRMFFSLFETLREAFLDVLGFPIDFEMLDESEYPVLLFKVNDKVLGTLFYMEIDFLNKQIKLFDRHPSELFKKKYRTPSIKS